MAMLLCMFCVKTRGRGEKKKQDENPVLEESINQQQCTQS